jgi:hypothetical protein
MKRNLIAMITTLILCAAAGPLAHAQRCIATVPLDETAKAALISALAGPEGEYAARAEYAAIVAKFGPVQPYANILQAEHQHVAALQKQCAKFGVPVPADTYQGQVTAPETLLEAATAGVAAELLNVEMYDGLLAQVQNYPSLVQVFSNLQAASLNNHLPAFEAAVANGGTVTCPTGCAKKGAGGCGRR